MRKGIKKGLALGIALTMTGACLTGCGKSNTGDTAATSAGDSAKEETTAASDDTPSQADTTAAAEENALYSDLGGMSIVIGDWWTSADAAEPTTDQEEATLEYRNEIQQKYNFTISQQSIGAWSDIQETFTLSTMANDPAAQVCLMDQSFLAKPIANGLFYDLSTLSALDFTQSKWNQNDISEMTIGGKTYGMVSGKSEPRGGIFWNKRMFEDAGLDADLPYDLQASGDWDWDHFTDICKTLTRDTDNDGVTDVYATASFSNNMFPQLVAANGAEYIGIDDTGKFYNASNTPEFLEAMNYGVSLISAGYEMPQPEGSDWDWFIAAFHDGNVAMTFSQEYMVGTWADMTDDWGFVMTPKGPEGDYVTVFSDNIAVIPSCYDAETANKIAFAYDLYTNPTPGYEDDDDWKTSYYSVFRDERAVDETLNMMFEEGHGTTWVLPLVYGTGYGDIDYDVYSLATTPEEKIETVGDTWSSLIDDANYSFSN